MVTYTTVTDIGYRPYQEDRFANEILLPGYTFCGVFDGHGGDSISELCAKNFPTIIKQGIQDIPYDLSFVINKSFFTMDNLAYHFNKPTEGSTVVFTLVTPDTIWFANAGDSASIVGFKDLSFRQMSMEHKVENENEKERIKKSGGFITYFDGVARVNGNLNVARSVGDHYLKDFVICTPFIQSISIGKENVDFILLISDGISDVMDPEKLSKIIQDNRNLPRDKLLKHIIFLAKNLGSRDNMTITLIEF